MDIIINNAGISEFSPITETSVEDFDKILSINLRPVFITSRTLACIANPKQKITRMAELSISVPPVI